MSKKAFHIVSTLVLFLLLCCLLFKFPVFPIQGVNHSLEAESSRNPHEHAHYDPDNDGKIKQPIQGYLYGLDVEIIRQPYRMVVSHPAGDQE
jgi:hypothetical protein